MNPVTCLIAGLLLAAAIPQGPAYDGELEKLIRKIEKQMKAAAVELNFEMAAELRDRMMELKKHLQEVS